MVNFLSLPIRFSMSPGNFLIMSWIIPKVSSIDLMFGYTLSPGPYGNDLAENCMHGSDALKRRKLEKLFLFISLSEVHY